MGSYDLSFLTAQPSLSRTGRMAEKLTQHDHKKKKKKRKKKKDPELERQKLEIQKQKEKEQQLAMLRLETDDTVETVFEYAGKDDGPIASSPRRDEDLEGEEMKKSKHEKSLLQEQERIKMDNFLSRTAAGRSVIKKREDYNKSKEKKVLTLDNVSLMEQSERNTDRGSFFFRSVSRQKRDKNAGGGTDQNFPSVGYYNPKFKVVSEHVSHNYDIAKTMKKTKPRQWKKRPFTSPNLQKIRKEDDAQSVKSDHSNLSGPRYDVSGWLESRRPRTEETPHSVFQSKTQRSQLGHGEDSRDYWPMADKNRLQKSKKPVDFTRSIGRDDLPSSKKTVLDPIYKPNFNMKFTRTSIGRHEIGKYCGRATKRRTTRQGITSQDDRFNSDLATQKFYDFNDEQHKFDRTPTAPDFERVGREDPRNNYLIHHYRKQKKKKHGSKSSQHDQSELTGFLPIEASSKSRRLTSHTDFRTQLGREFSMEQKSHDLDYDVDIDAVRPRSKGMLKMSKQLSRPPPVSPSHTSKKAPDFYNVRLTHSSKSQRSPQINVRKSASRDRHTNAFLSRMRAGEVNDIETPYKHSQQKLKLQHRSTGNPMISKQIGRDEINRLRERHRAAPDKFYLGINQPTDKFKKNKIPPGANLAFAKTVDRFEKFPGAMRKEGDLKRPYVVRGQKLEERSPPVGSYNVKYKVIDKEPRKSAFPVSLRKDINSL